MQTNTWLATYPDAKLGITEDDIRRRIIGKDRELLKRRISDWREGIAKDGPTKTTYVAKVDGKVVGFTLPLITSDGQHSLGALYVLPEFQGHGIGYALAQKNLDWHGNQPIYLAVAAYNQRAISFYKSFGFVETGKKLEDLTARKLGEKELPEIEMFRPAP